jgi:hypothetical protein
MHQLRSFVHATQGESLSPARELAERRTGTVEVRLLWNVDVDRVELSVRDSATAEGFHVEVAPEEALEAFYHPYVYAPRQKAAVRGVRAGSASDDD